MRLIVIHTESFLKLVKTDKVFRIREFKSDVDHDSRNGWVGYCSGDLQ